MNQVGMQASMKIERVGPSLERGIQHAIDRFQRFRLIDSTF